MASLRLAARVGPGLPAVVTAAPSAPDIVFKSPALSLHTFSLVFQAVSPLFHLTNSRRLLTDKLMLLAGSLCFTANIGVPLEKQIL